MSHENKKRMEDLGRALEPEIDRLFERVMEVLRADESEYWKQARLSRQDKFIIGINLFARLLVGQVAWYEIYLVLPDADPESAEVQRLLTRLQKDLLVRLLEILNAYHPDVEALRKDHSAMRDKNKKQGEAYTQTFMPEINRLYMRLGKVLDVHFRRTAKEGHPARKRLAHIEIDALMALLTNVVLRFHILNALPDADYHAPEIQRIVMHLGRELRKRLMEAVDWQPDIKILTRDN